MELTQEVIAKAQVAKQASRQLAGQTTEIKNAALQQMADALWREREAIFQANELDIAQARAQGTSEARIDRLIITENRLREMITGLEQIIDLPDPVGQVIQEIEHPAGMRIAKTSVPFGVIAMIYESRPNVTVDAVGLTVKTGNAVVLRGGKEALHSNQALVNALRAGLAASEVSPDSIQFVNRIERETVDILIRAKGIVDLAIPRGGAGLIQRVIERAQVPVIETGVGNCHIYVHKSADPVKTMPILLNAKTQRPSVCNAVETLLVDDAYAHEHLAAILSTLHEHGVEVRGCEQTQQVAKQLSLAVNAATEADYASEHLDLILSVKVVADLDAAIDHITRYGTQHSEAIIAEDEAAAKQFLTEIDAAAVYHNVSTRFTDGFEFGFGAEIGISTQKLHARGPMGLAEMTSYKYVIRGEGQVRG